MARFDGEATGIKTDRIPPVVFDGPIGVQPSPGRVVAGRYEIRARLGAGGMGSVWRAYDRELEEEVALKVLLPERLHDQAMLENLRREVKLARRITHPNVCRVFDYGEDDDLHFLTMELIEGRTLRALLAAGALDAEGALTALQQVVEGLAAVHAQGIIHRDLKPENVIMRSTGQAVVADFGLARAPLADQGAAGEVAGTPAYMSPEQLRGEPLDARSDIFSLGLLAFEMLTGRSPFEGGSSVTKSRAILREPPHSLEVPSLPPHFVRALDKALARAMAKTPAERFGSVAEFGAALAAARREMRGEAAERPAGWGRRAAEWVGRRRLNRWAALGVAVALPAASAVAMWADTGDTHQVVDTRPTVLVAPLNNLTGDPSWNGFAQVSAEAIRTGLRTMPQVRLLDGPSPGGWGFGAKQPDATWVTAGSVQRVGASLRLAVQLRAPNNAVVGEPVEIDGDPADPGGLPEVLRRRTLDEVKLLVSDHERRRRAETATKSDLAKARLLEYYDLIKSAPRPEDFEAGKRLLDQALAADPRYVPALIERALLLLKVSQTQARQDLRAAALADVEQALAIDPQEPRALAFRCRAMQIKSAFDDRATDASIAAAMAACNDALRVEPTSATVRLALARLDERACNTEIAMKQLEGALELDHDRSQSGWLLLQLVHVALQEGKTTVADRASQQLVEFYEEERRLGARAYSRRAGVSPVPGAHLLRAAVLMQLDQPESIDRAGAELLGELDIIAGGMGDHWSQATALRGLLRIAALQGRPAPSAWKKELDALERDYRATARETPSNIRGAALTYRWFDPDAALELLALLGAPASFQEAFDHALIYHAAGKDDEARKVLALHPAAERWEKGCRDWIQPKLAQ